MTRSALRGLLAAAALPGLLAAQPARPAPARLDSTTLMPALKARAIGPAIMGGRVSDIALDPADPYTFYVALGTAGVMKTTTNGTTWQPVFESQPVAAVGAVAVSPADAKTVWVGTGEANDRNSVSWGDGVYLSTDGGGSWKNVGLRETRMIARVAPHPTDAKTAYVAAAGDVWNETPERGCYRTTDAGATWRRVLAADAPWDRKVGCGDIAVDPVNPRTVYAALYARRRTPWAFRSGPEHTDGRDLGGIFRSDDGGETWKKLSGGLPSGTGRIGLSVYAKDPRIVYAIVESDAGGTASIDDVRSKAGGVFRSEDRGETWTRVNALNPRPFYFSQIRVDPTNDRKVYVLGFTLHVSEDGGRTFREDRFKAVHADLHALVIDPRTPARLLLGTDGGPYQSYDGGAGWQHLNNMAAGEFYRINVDSGRPYRICGGLQDNLNWVGPSATRTADGIVNADWINVQGGDGFYCFFDPREPQVVFTESQSGYVHRFDLRSGAYRDLRPEAAEGREAFRFHWNSPLIPSRHDPDAFYLAGNRVFRLTGRGERWRTISPDLSARQTDRILSTGSGAETYGVVYALSESPVRKGMLWAGTDDGKLWVTRDDGATWTDLTRGLPAPVRGQWIYRLEASHADAEVAYLAVDAHREGNYGPLAYRTEDGGRTWQSIAAGLPAHGPVKVIREDPRNPDVLYLGTEFALFASTDRGRSWFRFGGLPTVAIDDILVHPREQDLVVATHGRSLYVVDDLRPLQEMNATVAAKAAHLFTIRPATAYEPLPGWKDSGGNAEFRGANPPVGALISYWVKGYTGAEASFVVTDAAGATVANLSGPGTPGLNRITWDLKPTQDLLSPYGGDGRRTVRPGEYTVTMTYGAVKDVQKVVVDVLPGIETN